VGGGHSNRPICESAGAIECLGTPMGKRLAVTTSIPESISQESSEVDVDDRVGGSFTVNRSMESEFGNSWLAHR
jgi:hypothetical protein